MTTKDVVLRDRRLRGGVPDRPGLAIVNTDGATPLARAFAAITAIAGAGRIENLFILCHGRAGRNVRAGMSADAGGMGLRIGHEGLLHHNVSMWRAIHGKVQNIVVYACAAADTQPENVGTDADGKYLMGALAIHTNAAVFAAEKIQWYFTYRNLRRGRFDFTIWDGKLWRFPPSGGRAVEVLKPSKDLASILPSVTPRGTR